MNKNTEKTLCNITLGYKEGGKSGLESADKNDDSASTTE
jgi:hypothetical protein